MSKNFIFLMGVWLFFKGQYACSQEAGTQILLPQYGTYFDISADCQLGDTIIWKITKTSLVKIIFFDRRGKSYSEVYENGRLIEKGYYENSLDTLKVYSRAYKRKKAGPIRVLTYFEPVKEGTWLERRDGKLTEIKYKQGEEL